MPRQNAIGLWVEIWTHVPEGVVRSFYTVWMMSNSVAAVLRRAGDTNPSSQTLGDNIFWAMIFRAEAARRQ